MMSLQQIISAGAASAKTGDFVTACVYISEEKDTTCRISTGIRQGILINTSPMELKLVSGEVFLIQGRHMVVVPDKNIWGSTEILVREERHHRRLPECGQTFWIVIVLSAIFLIVTIGGGWQA